MKTNVKVTSAEYIGGYKIKFEFSDGHKSVLDLYSFLSAKGQNPMSSKYLDKNKFKKFEIVDGMDISWNEMEMCFQFKTLYKGGEVAPITMKEKISFAKRFLPKSKLKSAIMEIEKQYA